MRRVGLCRSRLFRLLRSGAATVSLSMLRGTSRGETWPRSPWHLAMFQRGRRAPELDCKPSRRSWPISMSAWSNKYSPASGWGSSPSSPQRPIRAEAMAVGHCAKRAPYPHQRCCRSHLTRSDLQRVRCLPAVRARLGPEVPSFVISPSSAGSCTRWCPAGDARLRQDQTGGGDPLH